MDDLLLDGFPFFQTEMHFQSGTGEVGFQFLKQLSLKCDYPSLNSSEVLIGDLSDFAIGFKYPARPQHCEAVFQELLADVRFVTVGDRPVKEDVGQTINFVWMLQSDPDSPQFCMKGLHRAFDLSARTRLTVTDPRCDHRPTAQVDERCPQALTAFLRRELFPRDPRAKIEIPAIRDLPRREASSAHLTRDSVPFARFPNLSVLGHDLLQSRIVVAGEAVVRIGRPVAGARPRRARSRGRRHQRRTVPTSLHSNGSWRPK
jgi:hypothetical protein